MAWNPTPDVQVARDAAKSLSKAGRTIDRCIILFTTQQGQIGYVSYGKDSERCGQARRLADAMYERAVESLPDIEDFHHRLDGELADGMAVNWHALEREAVLKIQMLRESIKAFPAGDLRQAYMRDLVMPAVELLARFLSCVNIEESEDLPTPKGTHEQ